jgi:hypothetical protein
LRLRHRYNPNTFFDADRCAGGVQRAIDFDELAAIDVVEDKVPKWAVIFVVIKPLRRFRISRRRHCLEIASGACRAASSAG